MLATPNDIPKFVVPCNRHTLSRKESCCAGLKLFRKPLGSVSHARRLDHANKVAENDSIIDATRFGHFRGTPLHIPAWGKLLLVLLSLGFLFGPGIQHHWKIARDPYFVPFDAVQYLPAFFKFDANDPVPTTYIKEYFLNAICPPLYKASLALGARFADVRAVQLVLMYAAYSPSVIRSLMDH